jgi:serine/threonine protein kinase
MKSERWRQISRLYQEALERDSPERAAFLNEVCVGDAALRQEVESLLAYEHTAEGFMAVPAIEVTADMMSADPSPSLVGRQLGTYRILSRLGAGGMGEVYRAHDTKLGRDVAVKVLPDTLLSDPERLARFEREARLLAALNHPHIVTVHSFETAEGIHFLTLELLEGRSLDQIIPEGGFALGRFFHLAIPLADAASAAHVRGITHRDLKPGNIMMTGDGRIKVLDFGLAKLRQQVPKAETQSPTEFQTQEGYVQGTVPYMSPEQLQGRGADHRTDIFSLGVVLYELITGRRPFQGNSVAELTSSILRDAPPLVTEQRADLPRHLARIIRRCLEKDPDRRYQVTQDLRNDLEDLRNETAETISSDEAQHTPLGRESGTRTSKAQYVRAATLADVRRTGCTVVHAGGHTIVLFMHGERIYAVDNRCPHMGFPLDRGSVKDCILTCHWHHARFDLATGGTFDPWADDVRVFPVEVRNDEVWVDLALRDDLRAYQRVRVREGLEQNIPLVLAKAVIPLLDRGENPASPFRTGLEFGTRYRRQGWGQGLTILTCMSNLLSRLQPEDRPCALYHGLSAVASDAQSAPPRFGLRPLPDLGADLLRLKRWLRQFVEVRDPEGAERCIISAVRTGANHRQLADMLFATVTDHRYLQGGHVLDFTNKAFEALDTAGWDMAESVLASLARGFASADRMEESNTWRNPVDLIAILERTFAAIPTALEIGQGRRGSWAGREPLLAVLLGDDPQSIADRLLAALRDGATEDELAAAVAHAAARRIVHFHTSNEFNDWDTALHTFTFANAVHQGLRRTPSPELVRGVFDAALSVYLDRFLNVPSIPLPEATGTAKDGDARLKDLEDLLDRQQQVNEAGALVVDYLSEGNDQDRLLAVLGRALLREDRNFHTIQAVEAAFRQYELSRGTPAATHVLVAAARFLAAHAPTVRAQGQTYQIARRLHRGERLYEEA